MRYLVTGGAGFIGSHLVDKLIANDHEVVVLDDLSTGRPENLPAAASLIVGDVADTSLVARCSVDCDGIFHLAAIASVQRSHQDWLGTHRTNQTASIAVLAASAKRTRRIPVVSASSAAVYGNSTMDPLTEAITTCPITPYGADKLGTELHANVAWQSYGVPGAALRFFNVFGPRQDPRSEYSGVISIFIDRIANSEPVLIYGDGAQTRDFVFVEDVADHLLEAMRSITSRPRFLVCNVCTGRPVAINNVATTIATALGRQANITYAAGRLGDILHSRGDNSLARQELGISARTPFEEGIAETLRHYARQESKPESR